MVGPTGSTIVIADDHALIRSGMRALLEQLAPSQPLQEAETAENLMVFLQASSADVHTLFLDLGLPGFKGAEVLEQVLVAIEADKVCVVSGETNPHIVGLCMAQGVRGYIAKGLPDHQLLEAVKAVLSGSPCYAGVEVLYRQQMPAHGLSSKQEHMLQYLSEGKSYEEIAPLMGLTVHGVHYHARQIFKMLNVKNRYQAVAKINISKK